MEKLVILIGESGAGKDSVQRGLKERYNISPVVLYTTRPKGDTEIDGVNYNFISVDEFKSMIDDDVFIYWATFNGFNNGKKEVWYYGLKKFELDKKYCVITDITNVDKIRNYFGAENCACCYITAPVQTRRERAQQAKNRKNFELKEWIRRIKVDKVEYKDVDKIADYKIENTGSVYEAVNDVMYYVYVQNQK